MDMLYWEQMCVLCHVMWQCVNQMHHWHTHRKVQTADQWAGSEGTFSLQKPHSRCSHNGPCVLHITNTTRLYVSHITAPWWQWQLAVKLLLILPELFTWSRQSISMSADECSLSDKMLHYNSPATYHSSAIYSRLKTHPFHKSFHP